MGGASRGASDAILDLARAGARFSLERETGRGSGGIDAVRLSLSSLSVRHALRGSPAWIGASERLIVKGVLPAQALDDAIAQKRDGESLAQVLLRATDVPEGTVAETLARATGAPVVRLTTDPVHGEELASPADALAGPRHTVLVDPIAAQRIPHAVQARHDVILVAAWQDEGVLAMVDPGDDLAAAAVEDATGLRITRAVALASQVRLAIRRCAQPRADVALPEIAAPRQALPFLTAVAAPLLVLVVAFLWLVRDAFDLRQYFAIAALGLGLFFFSYALRYYVTTFVVVGTVLFGHRLRRQRALSTVRAGGSGAGPAGEPSPYRTLRGETLDDVGAIQTGMVPGRGLNPLAREDQPFVSVHLAMYNEAHVIDRLLRACTSFDYDEYEVIVADDSTDPDALALLARWQDHPRVRVLHRGTRKGFKGGALQEALKRMDPRTEYVMIFDADFIPPPDAIWHFLDYFGRLPGPGERPEAARPDDPLAAVQGYQWHMLNASENWITKGIRAEFSGSYVLERAAQELFGTLKMISGSVYMIRADVLRRLGWSTSITEDWELTIRLYLAGHKVLYTPYIQAPSECVSRLKQLIRQRMRWARGHTFNVKKYFLPVIASPRLTWREKLEFLYYAPYYLQSILFLLGSVSWLTGTFLLGQRLPAWGETLGWSLVISNVLALPLMNTAGLVLERSVRRDVVGLFSFIGLSTIVAPFQGWAALCGLLAPVEGGWARTPKSGRITESAGQKLAKVLPWELPRKVRVPGRLAHLALTCVAIMLAGGILTVGALSIKTAAAEEAIRDEDLILPFILGTLLPLAIVAYGWLKLHRRVAVCVLAAAIGLSANVVFLATAVPADATAGDSSTFWLRGSTGFGCADKDMVQSAPATDTAVTATATTTFCSDTFISTQTIETGTVQVVSWATNTNALTPCVLTFTLKRNETGLNSATRSVPALTLTPAEATTNISITGFTFATDDRLKLTVAWAGSGCGNTTLYYDSTGRPSRVLATTIVPEALIGLLLAAPLVPYLARRRWASRAR